MSSSASRSLGAIASFLLLLLVAVFSWWLINSFLSGGSAMEIAPANAVLVSAQKNPSKEMLSKIELFQGISIGQASSFAQIETQNGNDILGLQMKSQASAAETISLFGSTGEPFTITQYPRGKLYSPSFSSLYTFAQMGKWALFSTNEADLVAVLSAEKITDSQLKSLQKDVPSGSEKTVVFRSQGLTSEVLDGTMFAEYAPLVLGLKDIIPMGMMALDSGNEKLRMKAKFLTKKGLPTPKTPPKNQVPQVLSHISSEIGIVLTGSDFIDTYGKMELFLREQLPDVGVLLSAAVAAQKEQVIGKENNFPADLLSEINGEYGFVIDIEQGNMSAAFVTLTQTEAGANKAVQFMTQNAIAKGTPQIVTKELADGTIREEFVMGSKRAFGEPTTMPNGKLYAPQSGTGMAIAQSGNLLIFASNAAFAKDILSTNAPESLAQNGDMISALKGAMTISHGYGIINPQKFQSLIYVLDLAEKDSQWLAEMQQYRRGIFARKFLDDSFYWDAVFYK